MPIPITIPKTELWDNEKEEFVIFNGQTIILEHSLVSISKWESKWQKPFLLKGGKKTTEEILDYVRCMTITQNVNPYAYQCLTKKNIDDIIAYIDSPMTATTFSEKKKSTNKQIITSELIYYWMIESGIPFECEKWHINRLLTLIQVCSAERERVDPNNKSKPSKAKMATDYAALNAARRKALNTKG